MSTSHSSTTWCALTWLPRPGKLFPPMQRWLDWDAAWTQRLRLAEQPGLLRYLAILFAHSGDSWFWALGLGLTWWLGSPAWRLRVQVIFFSILALACLVLVIKFTVRRQRPAGEWGRIYRRTDPHSFPSGHAARSALIAVLALGLGPAWFGWIALAWAPLVTLARVAMGVHYLSDVLAGALLGVILGIALLLWHPWPII